MVKDNPLAGWVLQHIGPGKDYSTPRAWSLALGLNQDTLRLIIERGRGDPETLVKLAESVGTSPALLFHYAGWLRPEDVGEALPEWESKMLVGARRLPPVLRRSLLDVTLPGLLRLAQDLEPEADKEGP